jgi:hypothetical protein
VEAYLYLGKEMVPMFAFEIKRSSWSQIFWLQLCGSNSSGGCDDDHCFIINGIGTNPNAMDYLLAVAFEYQFPTVTLVNTPAPLTFDELYVDTSSTTAPTPDVVASEGTGLVFYLSDGSIGLAAGTLYIGSMAAIESFIIASAVAANPDIPLVELLAPGGIVERALSIVLPFTAFSPRHRVGWGSHAVLAATEDIAFVINGQGFEEKSKHAIYSDLQFKMREDVWMQCLYRHPSVQPLLPPCWT